MSEQSKSENNWAIEALLIEAHHIILNHSKALAWGFLDPKNNIRIVYPPRPALEEVDMINMTDQEIEWHLSGQLSKHEILAIQSMGLNDDKAKSQIFERIFVEYFSRFFISVLHIFDGTTDPKLVEATDRHHSTWVGAKILACSSHDEEYLSKNPSNPLESNEGNYSSLQDNFYDAYDDFNRLIMAEDYRRLKVKNFKDDLTVIDTIFIEMYCEIEIASRELIKDLSSLNVSFIFPLNETITGITEQEQQVIQSIGLQYETTRVVLQKVFAAYCHDVIARWLEAFNWRYSSPVLNKITEQQGKTWLGAKIAASGYEYPDMLHDAFYSLWHEFNEIISQPPKRPF